MCAASGIGPPADAVRCGWMALRAPGTDPPCFASPRGEFDPRVTARFRTVVVVMSRAFPGSVALINPMADYGIDTYTHELARGLAENGVHVDVFTADVSRLIVPYTHPNYRRFRVLGSRLPRVLADSTLRSDSGPVDLPRRTANANGQSESNAPVSHWRTRARQYFLSGEFALYLRNARYDVVWTQWPDLGAYAKFWTASRWLRLPVVHTVHNIFPHERFSGDIAMCERAYDTARLLFVHSKPVRDELTALFPALASKVVAMPHGTYTVYPRQSGARSRLRAAMNIPVNATVLLCCGAIKPYKNVDACIHALAAIDRDDVWLVIAGSEGGAPPHDQLARTRAIVREVGVEDRVRLLPGFLDETAMAELFEAIDVLMVPYVKSYGSGLLMLGITFGKCIIATRSGMEEAASQYPGAILLEGSSVADIRRGVELALRRISEGTRSIGPLSPAFDWKNIAGQCLADISRVLPHP